MTSSLAKIEALLFVSGEPLARSVLAKLLGLSKQETDAALSALGKQLAEAPDTSLMLVEHDHRVELATKPEYAPLVEALIQTDREAALSQPALEVLSIVAYRSPVTRSEIEAIRGVNCSFTLRNLLLRGLIERSENPEDTREYLYRPTFAFLEKLGLRSIEELPEYAVLSQDERLHRATDTPDTALKEKKTA